MLDPKKRTQHNRGWACSLTFGLNFPSSSETLADHQMDSKSNEVESERSSPTLLPSGVSAKVRETN